MQQFIHTALVAIALTSWSMLGYAPPLVLVPVVVLAFGRAVLALWEHVSRARRKHAESAVVVAELKARRKELQSGSQFGQPVPDSPVALASARRETGEAQ
jgi:uncharacterized membrane protein